LRYSQYAHDRVQRIALSPHTFETAPGNLHWRNLQTYVLRPQFACKFKQRDISTQFLHRSYKEWCTGNVPNIIKCYVMDTKYILVTDTSTNKALNNTRMQDIFESQV
jgi:hypothetical protein